ncbi:MAG: type 1 glutamine amidotransferase domain-containing protein [Oceanospirillaceae bacterium]|nr:type 1 glutamine amidotransferase domain-containing protein [Oceanospirillaceae bacterium]MBT11885.1 type 1 glutamine amidotransferase domain-containing protein [Oceanospirillaceae bacterium]
MKKVLIPVTNHAKLGDTDQDNGTYAPELTHALHVFIEQGVDYDIASINGGKVPVYGTDIEGDEVNASVLASEDVQHRLNNSLPVSDVNIADYDAVFYPGGFGLLTDLAHNEDFAKLAASHYENGGLLGAVCHGPAAFLPITLSSGEALLADKSVTAFTREEEIDYGTIDDIPFLLEEALARKAARFSKVKPWEDFVIEDGRVISGQNPTSAHSVAKAMVKQLGL